MAIHGISSYTAMIVWYSKEVLQKMRAALWWSIFLVVLNCWVTREFCRCLCGIGSEFTEKELVTKTPLINGWHHSNAPYCYSYNCNTHFKNFHVTPLSNLQPTIIRIEIVKPLKVLPLSRFFGHFFTDLLDIRRFQGSQDYATPRPRRVWPTRLLRQDWCKSTPLHPT